MAKLLKLRRGTTSQHSSFTGAEGEVTVDTDKESLVVHNGSTAGGFPIARADGTGVSNFTITGELDAATLDISGNADIDGTLEADAYTVNGTALNEYISDTVGAMVGSNTETGIAVTYEDSDNTLDFAITSIPGVTFTGDVIFDNGTTAGKDITWDESNDHLVFSDNVYAKFGDGGDLQISHDGTNSTIDNNTNDLIIRCDGDDIKILAEDDIVLRDNDDSTNFIHCINGGAVDLYHNGTKKFETTSAGVDITGNIAVSGTVDGRDVATDGTKLDGIEASATADQTNAEIRAAVEAASDSNVFTDADHSKLNAIEASATADQTNAEIRAAVEAASDSNVFTDADHTKLNGIESSATADQSNAEIRAAVEAATDSNVFTDADHTKLNGIETSATADQTGAEVLALINSSDIYTSSKIGRDAGDYLAFTTDTRMDIYVNGNNEFRFEADGDFHADGDVIAYSTTTASDRRLKENIEVVPKALDKVQLLNGVTFDWKRNGEKSAGVIAQEVLEVLPEAVKEVTPLAGGDNYLTVNYHALTSILIESIKELKTELEELKGGN